MKRFLGIVDIKKKNKKNKNKTKTGKLWEIMYM